MVRHDVQRPSEQVSISIKHTSKTNKSEDVFDIVEILKTQVGGVCFKMLVNIWLEYC